MKSLILLVAVLAMSGCAGFNDAMEVTGDVLNTIDPTPIVPSCDASHAYTTYQGQTCTPYSDGSYRWLEVTK